MWPLKMWQMCFYEKSGNSMDYPQRFSLIWTQSSLENSGNLFASHSTSKEECQQPTTPKLTNKQKEPTKYWKVTYKTLSIMIRTTGINCCHWPSTPATTSYQCTWNVTHLCQLWFSSANRMDEGTRSAEPRGSSILPLDANNPCSGTRCVRTNTRKHEQILRSKSQATTRHQGWWSSPAQGKKYSYQAAGKEIKSKTLMSI